MRSPRIPMSILVTAVLVLNPLAQTVPEPSAEGGGLTLAHAKAEALRNNPELEAAEAGWRASQGAARQARSLLNPTLDVSRDDFGGTVPLVERAPQEAIGVSQTIRLSGKRKAEVAAADSASTVAREQLRQAKLDLMATVEKEFAELLGAQERERIAAENLDTAREMSRVVQALVDAGEASPIEAVRAQNEQDLAAIDGANAAQELAAARSRMARTLGRDGKPIGRAEGVLPEEASVPDEAAALASIARLPDLMRWTAETARLEASLQRARREAIPDPTLSFGMRRYTTTREKAYFAGISIPLPVFNHNRGGIIEASARLDQGRLEMRAEELRLRAAVQSARSALHRSVQEVDSLRGKILPNAERVYSALNEGYLRGNFRLLDLLEARRSLAVLRLRSVDARVRLCVAKADLDRLVAIEVDLQEGVTP
ncbi:MAG: TolC family protein [Acidobacteriota bacterium]